MRLNYFTIGSQGQIIRDKISGKLLTVTSVTDGKVTAVEQDENGEIFEGGQVFEITEENAICFRYLKDPNPKAVPSGYGFDAENLVAPDGKKIPLGNIVLAKIIGYIRGLIVCLCEEGDTPVLRLYDVMKDKFGYAEQLLSSNIRVLFQNEETVVIATDDMKTEKDEESGEDVITFTKTRITTIYKKYINYVDVPYVIKDAILNLDETGKVAILTVNEQVEDGALVPVPKPFSVKVDVCNDFYTTIQGVYTEGKIGNSGNTTLIGPDGVYAEGELIKVDTAGLSGYLNLVDTTVEADGKVVRSLANEDRQVKKLVTEETADRGALTTVA